MNVVYDNRKEYLPHQKKCIEDKFTSRWAQSWRGRKTRATDAHRKDRNVIQKIWLFNYVLIQLSAFAKDNAFHTL